VPVAPVSAMTTPELWFEAPLTVRRFVSDLVASELRALRPGYPVPAQPWPDDLRLDHDGLGCDSLELLALSSAVAEATLMQRSGVEDYLLARRTIADWEAIVALSLSRYSAAMTFLSSGTTHPPSPSTHQLPHLCEEIRELAALLPGRRRLFCAVPAHHIYGFLFSVLLPQVLQIPVVDARSLSPSQLVNQLRAGDLVIGHPAFWSAVSRAATTIAADVSGVTSTSPCSPVLANALSEQGLSRLLQIYGSSETSGIGWRDTPDGNYRLLSYWRRHDNSTIARPGVDGHEVSHRLPDYLDWSDAHCFTLAGRRDGAVQVGGVNVVPDQVADRLRAHTAIADVAVRAMRPEEGMRLKAFVVPHDLAADPDGLTIELTHWCDTHLPVAERPKVFTFGASLPRGPLHKLSDWAVAQ
jgi:long-chain acyl-CoA synthetase